MATILYNYDIDVIDMIEILEGEHGQMGQSEIEGKVFHIEATPLLLDNV